MAKEWEAIVDPEFRNVIAKYRYRAKEIVNLNMVATIRALQDEGIKIAQQEVRSLVYNAVIPPSIAKYNWWTEESYMAVRRIGTVWRAIVKEDLVATANVVYGDIKVDRTGDLATTYYAWVLNQGGYDTRPGTYPPKPFWTNTYQRLKPIVVTAGTEGLLKIKMELLAAGA